MPEESTVYVESIVSRRTMEPKVNVMFPERPPISFSPEEARQLAVNIFRAAESAESDAFLMSFARGNGMDLKEGAALVNEFRKWREKHDAVSAD